MFIPPSRKLKYKHTIILRLAHNVRLIVNRPVYKRVTCIIIYLRMFYLYENYLILSLNNDCYCIILSHINDIKDSLTVLCAEPPIKNRRSHKKNVTIYDVLTI